MVKVKVKVCFSGIDFAWNINDEVEVSESESESMIAAGFAEAVALLKKETEPLSEAKPGPEIMAKVKVKNKKKTKKKVDKK